MKNFEERVYKVPSDGSTSSKGASQRIDIGKHGKDFLARVMLLAAALVVGFSSLLAEVHAADDDFKSISKPKWAIDDTKWMTLGVGFRGSGVWAESRNYRNDFSIDNARLYVNGQVHEYVKFEINTECFFCNNTHPNDSPKMSYNVLDAIGKVEINRYLNFWGGRMLVPTERGELSGPFFQATHDAFKTPFFSQDFSTKFGSGGAGRYGRDDGGTYWATLSQASSRGRWAMQ